MENGKDGRNLDESGENRFENIPFFGNYIARSTGRFVILRYGYLTWPYCRQFRQYSLV
jgi:hypothetical protein